MLAKRDKLYQILDAEYLRPDVVPQGVSFTRLVQIVREEIGDVDWQTLEDSLRHLAGQHLDPVTLKDTCWRIVGNVPRLRLRRPVPPWHLQTIREWVPMLIIGARRVRNANNKLGAMLTFRILAGTSCPRITVKWLSLAMCKMLAGALGFQTRFRASELLKYPYVDPRQMVGFRLYAMVDPEECSQEPGVIFPFSQTKQGRIKLHKYIAPSTIQAYNREQICRTFRVDDGYTCPKRFPTTVQCHFCPFGYETCRAGKHRKDWVRKPCPECKRQNAFFDPEGGNVCVECANSMKAQT